jgi:hypothetical protein
VPKKAPDEPRGSFTLMTEQPRDRSRAAGDG